MRNARISALPGLILLSCLIRPALAEEMSMEEMMFFEIPSVTVASQAVKETVLNSVSTVSVIDQKMIEKYNFSTISEAVEVLAGISVWRTYLKKGLPTIRGILQDHYANKVLVMINHVPAWHAVTGEGELDRVSIHDVERIEVLKGPASVLYGSNAYTGAINIILKSAGQGNGAGMVYGGFGSGDEGFDGPMTSHAAGGHYTETGEDYAYFLAAGSHTEEWPGYAFAEESGNTVSVNEYLHLKNFTFNGRYGHHHVLFNSAVNHETYLGVTPKLSAGIDRDQAIELHLLNYTYDLNTADISGQYSLTFDWEHRNYSRAFDDNTRADIIGSRLVNRLVLDYDFLEHWWAELGGDYDYRVSSGFTNYAVYENIPLTENNLKDRSVHEGSVFAQVGYDLDPLKVIVGARNTTNDLFGNNTSARGTVVYTLNKTNSLKLIAGQSYRSPSLFELNFSTFPQLTVFGNPNLKPETSNSVELAYLTSIDKLFIQVLGYYATYENKIFRTKDTITIGGTTYTNQNVYANASRFTARGAELEMKYSLPSTQVFLNAAYVDGDDGDKAPGTDEYNFKYVPNVTGSAGIYQAFGPAYVSADVNYYGTMEGPLETIPANYWITATLGYKAGRWNHALSVRNLTGNDVVLPEYSRRILNAVPLISGTRIDYTFTLVF